MGDSDKLIDSLVVCLGQECLRFNRLLDRIRTSVANLKRAIKGEILMSPDLEKMFSSFNTN